MPPAAASCPHCVCVPRAHSRCCDLKGETADEREDLRLETRPTDPSFDDVMFSDVLSPTFSELEGHSRRLNDLLHLEFDASGKVLQPPGALTASPHQVCTVMMKASAVCGVGMERRKEAYL